MNVAVVILNWNGKPLLERFLPDVVRYSADEASIYVVDNASTDDSVAYCQRQFADRVTVIKNKRNGGYAAGYNEGLKKINADLYVLLNSDIAVTQNWLTPLIALFKEQPLLAAAQPKIKDLKRPTHFEYAGAAGGYIDRLGYPYCRGRIFDILEEDHGQYNDTVDIHWASGAALFVNASTYWEVGGLDEDYFAHQEEIDLCLRFLLAGYAVKAVGASEVYHLGGGTLASSSPQKTFYNFRNSLFNIVKHTPVGQVFLKIFARLILDGVAGLQFLLKGKGQHFLAILRAHVSFYAHFFQTVAKRKRKYKQNLNYRIPSIIWYYYVQHKKKF